MPSNESWHNFLSNEHLESFWDALWLELWPLYFILESRRISRPCLHRNRAATCSFAICPALRSSLSTCVSSADSRNHEEEHTICIRVCILFSMEAALPEEDFPRGTQVQRCVWHRVRQCPRMYPSAFPQAVFDAFRRFCRHAKPGWHELDACMNALVKTGRGSRARLRGQGWSRGTESRG